MIDKVDFLHVDKHKSLLQIDSMILMEMVLSIPRVPKITNMQCLHYLKKEVKDDVDFLHAEKVYFKSVGIKVSYKVDIIINGHDQAFSNYSK